MAKKTNWTAVTAMVALVLSMMGCQMVHVEDTEGNAIFWAEVVPSEGPESEGLPAYTDLMGNALLARPMEESSLQRITVSKDGYAPRTVLRNQDATINVVLQSAATPQSTDDAAAPMTPAMPPASDSSGS